MKSINQNVHRDALPDFRNLGVILRIVLIVLGLSLFVAIRRGRQLDERGRSLPADLQRRRSRCWCLSMLPCWDLSPWLRRLDYRTGMLVVILIEIVHASPWCMRVAGDFLGGDPRGQIERYWFFTTAASVLILYYFHLRSRALSPALTEARLQALQARIRPHFLFNSINAVLSLIRAEPGRAEDGAGGHGRPVSRADGRQPRPVARLVREVELTRQYLDLEQLRLGERLQVEWHTENMPGDALIPPLVLQPLVENAVYHGIEPRSEPGVVSINVYKVRDEVHMRVAQPVPRDGNHHAGNKMALANIRERLALHFDAEASLQDQRQRRRIPGAHRASVPT